MGLVGTDLEVRFLERDILELEAGELTDPEAGLEKELDNAIHTHVVTDRVAECAVLERREDAGGGDLVLGVRDRSSRGDGQDVLADEVLEE